MNRNLAVMTAVLGAGAFAWPVGAQEKKERTLTTVFEVTVRGTAASNITDGTSNTLMIAGVATMNVDSTGAFSGQITSGKDADGKDIGAVVFRGANLDRDLDAPKSLALSGQVNGHMMSLTIKFPEGYVVFGVGASTDDLGSMPTGPLTGTLAGTATADTLLQSGTDGTSSTVLLGDLVVGRWAASSRGIRILMGDGSVRFISNSTAP